MPEATAAPAATWIPRTPSGPVLRFLLATAAFWLAALVLWQLGEILVAVLLTGLGAAVPLGFLGTARTRARLWTLRISASPDEAEAVLRETLASLSPIRLDPRGLSRGHPLRGCAGVVRIPVPPSEVGWSAPLPAAHPATPQGAGAVHVHARGGHEADLAVLLERIERALASLERAGI